MTTIQEALEGQIRPFKPVAVSSAMRKLLDERFPAEFKSKVMVGIEIELENSGLLEARNKDADVYGLHDILWQRKEDGSLRNHGIEYVTRIGTDAGLATQSLKLLSYILKTYAPKIQANARTGVHVHLNFLDKTPVEVACFSALYLLFEKSLFKFCGGRTQNVFCIPVRDSANAVGSIIRQVRKAPKDAASMIGWCARVPKYLSFGIGALRTFGTIELRQHEGTSNPEAVIPWLETLVHLYEYAERQELEPLLKRIRDLNTNSQYETLLREALPKVFIRRLGEPAVIQDMIQGCTYLKEVLIAPEEVGATNPIEEQDDFDHQVRGRFELPRPRGARPARRALDAVYPPRPDERLVHFRDLEGNMGRGTTYLRDSDGRNHFYLDTTAWVWQHMPGASLVPYNFNGIFVAKGHEHPETNAVPPAPWSRLLFVEDDGCYLLTDAVGKWAFQLTPDRMTWFGVHGPTELFTFRALFVADEFETITLTEILARGARETPEARRVVRALEPPRVVEGPEGPDHEAGGPLERARLGLARGNPVGLRPFPIPQGVGQGGRAGGADVGVVGGGNPNWDIDGVGRVDNVAWNAGPIVPVVPRPRFLGRRDRGPRNNNGN